MEQSLYTIGKNINLMRQGKAPIGWDGKSVVLHHNKGITVDFYDYKEINATFHSSYIHSNKIKERYKFWIL